VTNEQKSRTFDSNGVAADIRGMAFHHDRKNQRLKGRQKCRATKTNKDTTGICKCKLRLTLNIHHEDQSGGGFIFLSRKGNAFHTFHPQSPSGSLMISKRNVNPDIVDLIRKGQNACIPNTNMRKLAFETRQELISKSTLPQVTLTAEIARIATRLGGASNASNASIIQQLKALLSLVTTQEDRNSLSKLLGSFENDIYKAKAAAMTKRQQAFGSGTNADMQDMVDVSFGLPLDTDNKSTQNTYQSKRRKL
jgi:hypothetical protein